MTKILNQYWDRYYNQKGGEKLMWFSERDIATIQVEQKLPHDTAEFIWAKTEHSVPTMDIIPPKNGMRILEVGSGTGGFTIAYLLKYAEINFEMTALDFSQTSLEIAKKRMEPMQFTQICKFVCGDMLDLPFENNSFDLIICPSVLEHLPQQEKAIEEMARVCKKGGLVFISTDNKEAYMSRCSLWLFTNAISNVLKDLKLLNRPKGYFIASRPKKFLEKLKMRGLESIHFSYTEFGFPGFRMLIGMIKRWPRLERIVLPIIRRIEHRSASKKGSCHSVFLSLSQKINE